MYCLNKLFLISIVLKRVSLFSIILFLPLFLKAQPVADEKTAMDYPGQKGEVYFSFPKPEREVFSELLDVISIDNITDTKVFAYANAYEFQRFLKHHIPYTVLTHPGDVDFDLNMKTREELSRKDLAKDWDFYPSYEAYVELMYQFEYDYPDLVRIINIGQTVMGRDLLFAKISPQVEMQKPRPQFMYTSTIHGDETAGFVLSLRLIHHLVTGYDKDEDITQLMNSVDIWICPNENPDGTYTDDNSTVLGATRYNANNVDLNRNYPNPVKNPDDPMQPETISMTGFTDTINFIMSANMHGGIELVNFPFDSWYSWENPHADHDWWEFVMYEYVDTAQYYSPPGYMTGLGDGVTHGGDWYRIWGSRQDYFNYYRSCREFTLELSNQKLLDPLLLPAYWDYNHRSMINYIWQATYGVHGIVHDSETGDPLQAKISIPGHESNNSEVMTSMPYGNYNRPLLQGSYDISFSAHGYETKTVKEVIVTNHNTTYLDVYLDPVPLIAVYPEQINFGAGVVGDVYSKFLTIKNEGKEVLEIYSIIIEGDDVFYLEDPVLASEYLIQPGDNETIGLFFQPSAEMEYSAVLYIECNDPETPLVEVQLTGEGMSEIAVIDFSSDTLDFGDVLMGESKEMIFTVYNTGNIALAIYNIEIDENECFGISEDFPIYLEPGYEEDFTVTFFPQAAGEIFSEAIVYSNAGNSPEAGLLFKGAGIDPNIIAGISNRQFSVNVYPNPVKPNTQVLVNLQVTGNISIKLYSIRGVAVADIFDGHLAEGKHGFLFSRIYHYLEPGVYVLTVENDKERFSERIVKVN